VNKGRKHVLVTSLATGCGKTTFCAALTRILRAAGAKACAYKPMSEFSLFVDGTDLACVREGRLYGDDAAIHAETAGNVVPEELLGPCQRVMGPSYEFKNTLEHTGVSLYAERVTIWDGEPRSTLLVNTAAFDRAGLGGLAERLMRSAYEEKITITGNGLDDLAPHLRTAQRAVQTISDKLRSMFEIVITESFGFSGLPWSEETHIDVAVVLGLGVAMSFDGAAYLDAARAAAEQPISGDELIWLRLIAKYHPRRSLFTLIPTARVVRGLTPLRREVVPPYPSGEVPARMEELALRLISGVL
jgi:predicted P-loop ATPase/GTPase